MQRRKLNQENKDNKKKLFILLGVLALLILVGSVIAIKNRNNKQIEETPKETVLETVKESEKETQKESSKKENKKEDKKDKKVTQKKDDNKKVKEEVKEDGTVVIESEDEKGNKVVTKIKDNKVEKIVTDKTGKSKTERSNINDKENSGLKTKVKEVVREKETKKEKSVASKPSKLKQNTKTEKPKENKVTKPSPSKQNKPSETKPSTPSKPKETKKEVVRTTETQSISFNTIDNYAYTGGKSRVYQEGRNGVRTIVKEDGKVVSNTITTQPQDKIIERYVKVQSAEYKTIEKEVDDLDKPVYRERGRARWFVYNSLTGETKYFYSAGEAEDYMTDNEILGNWGTAEPEIIVTDEIIGYETKKVKEEVKVSDEVWEWKH